jgi:hypothetical protein
MMRQATKAARQGSAVKIILERAQRVCLRMQSTGAAAAVRGGGGQRGSGGAAFLSSPACSALFFFFFWHHHIPDDSTHQSKAPVTPVFEDK